MKSNKICCTSALKTVYQYKDRIVEKQEHFLVGHDVIDVSGLVVFLHRLLNVLDWV